MQVDHEEGVTQRCSGDCPRYSDAVTQEEFAEHVAHECPGDCTCA